MITYVNEFYEKMPIEGKKGWADLAKAVQYRAVQRVRPKFMTVMAMTMGLLPLMWSHGAGDDMMKRIAAPMLRGLATSTIITLVIIPAIYAIWKSRT